MEYSLITIALIYIQKYSPVKEVRERAVQQTIDFCAKLFPSLDSIEMRYGVKQAWELHVGRKEDTKEDKGYKFSYTPHLSAESEMETLPPAHHKSLSQQLEEEEKQLIEKWGAIGLRERLPDIFEYLSEQEKAVVELRFGMTNGYIYTVEEIGKFLGLTSLRVRRHEISALHKIKNHLE